GKPHAEPELKGAGHQPLKVGVTPRKCDLAKADAEPCPNGHQLRDVAVRPEGEADAVEPLRAPAYAADLRRLPIEADQGVVLKRVECARSSRAVEIAPVRIEADSDGADALDRQGLLGGLHHAHGNVRGPSQQVLDGVGERELDFKLGMAFAQRCQNWWQ